MAQQVIRLPNGKLVSVACYVASWRTLKGLAPHVDVRGFDHFPEPAGRVLSSLRAGMHDRINRHVPGYGVGRKWSGDWFWSVYRTARDLNGTRVRLSWVPVEFKSRLAHRVGGWER